MKKKSGNPEAENAAVLDRLQLSKKHLRGEIPAEEEPAAPVPENTPEADELSRLRKKEARLAAHFARCDELKTAMDEADEEVGRIKDELSTAKDAFQSCKSEYEAALRMTRNVAEGNATGQFDFDAGEDSIDLLAKVNVKSFATDEEIAAADRDGYWLGLSHHEIKKLEKHGVTTVQQLEERMRASEKWASDCGLNDVQHRVVLETQIAWRKQFPMPETNG